jgi:hypothetical protein
MKLNISATMAIAAIAATLVATPTFARDALSASVKQSIALQDGAMLHVFADGKTAKEDRYGRAQRMQPNEVLVAADGQKVTSAGDEVARLDGLLRNGHKGR